MRKPGLAFLLTSVFFACSDPAGPGEREVRLIVAGGDAQFGLPNSSLDLPLTVRATEPSRGTGVRDIEVTWRITAGQGAVVTVVNARTDGGGFASARLRLGAQSGTYRVEANSARNQSGPVQFSAQGVLEPTIQTVPATATALETVAITGSNFSGVASENTVLFGGLRARVVSASPTTLSVEVPRCVLDRSVDLTVSLGAIASDAVPVQTRAAASTPLVLARGQAVRFNAEGDLACIRLAGVPAGARYLVVPQNAVAQFGLPLPFELLSLASGGLPAMVAARRLQRPGTSAAHEFELRLRLSERAFGRTPAGSPALQSQSETAIPNVGDRRDFNVLTTDNKTRRVSAVVRAISDRAILYVDQDAPQPGLTTADLEGFGSLFDDPIFPTEVAAFGSPSDIDANGKIIVLFTPAVNALTGRNDSGFIAGYFYGCDLVEKSRCSATNSGEIFYSMVPDPAGTFSAARTKDTVLRTVPGVLAHEFQHMISFHRKGGTLDLLWLSEGLAHAAEDIMGDVFIARGDPQRAAEFKRPNYVRAQLWLRQVPGTSLVADESPGSLEQRGAAWTLVRYLTEHYGGQDLLRTLSGSTAVGDANVSAATGRPWQELLAEFAVAVWADRAPDLAGVSLEPRLTLGSFDLRGQLGTLPGGFPLNPNVISFADFLLSDQLEPGAHDYRLLQAPALSPPDLHLALNGLYGAPFPAASSAQLMLLRVR